MWWPGGVIIDGVPRRLAVRAPGVTDRAGETGRTEPDDPGLEVLSSAKCPRKCAESAKTPDCVAIELGMVCGGVIGSPLRRSFLA